MTKLAHVPLCPNCRLDGGWDYSDPDDPKRCDHGQLAAQVSAAVARDQGIADTIDAHPDAFKAAVKIIHDAAKAHPIVSSNTVRALMNYSQIPGPVRGAAWRQACTDRAVRPAGMEPSTDPGTHSHSIRIYESLIYRRAAS